MRFLWCLLLCGCVVTTCPPAPTGPDTPCPAPCRKVRVTLFSAQWCGPCKAFHPTFDSWRGKYKAEFRHIDIDRDRDEARKYKITAVPTVIIEIDGQITKRWVGAPSEADFAREVK